LAGRSPFRLAYVSDAISDLKNRLGALEGKLQKLLAMSHQDLEVAKRLQKLVVRDRLPKISGIDLFARHIPGQEIGAEAFDVIPTKDNRELYVLVHWTESFGLSSVLLQALVNLQSRATLESHPGISVEDLFEEIQSALKETQGNASYRLCVFHLDVHSLKYELIQKDFAPWLYSETGREWEYMGASGILAPGSRCFFLTAQWNPNFKDADAFYKPLDPTKLAEKNTLLEVMNEALFKAEAFAKDQGLACDYSSVGIQVDARKIHLA